MTTFLLFLYGERFLERDPQKQRGESSGGVASRVEKSELSCRFRKLTSDKADQLRPNLSGAVVIAIPGTQAVIVGHDWGSAVAWRCALLRPDIFRAVILLSTPYRQGAIGAQQLAQVSGCHDVGRIPRFARGRECFHRLVCGIRGIEPGPGPAAFSDHHVLVGPMTDDELRRAIERPTQLVGCELQTGLVDWRKAIFRQSEGALDAELTRFVEVPRNSLPRTFERTSGPNGSEKGVKLGSTSRSNPILTDNGRHRM